MKIEFLLNESISLSTTIKGLSADISQSVPATYRALTTAIEKFHYEHGTLKGFMLIAAGIGSRWHNAFYFDKIQKDLYDLVRFYPKESKELMAYLADGKMSFLQISSVLPDILHQLAQRIKSAQLEAAARVWIRARAAYATVKQALQAEIDDDDDTSPAPTQPSAIGGQNKQIEDIISHVLSSVPKSIAGDVRNIVAKSPHKLQTLKAELAKRGINI